MEKYLHVFQIILVISHGNASVESGFSINKDMLVENLSEKSVVSQRIISDAVRHAGGHLKINIDKEMMVKTRSSHSAYKDHLQKLKEADKEKIKGSEDRKRHLLELKALEAKRHKMQEQQVELDANIKSLKRIVS